MCRPDARVSLVMLTHNRKREVLRSLAKTYELPEAPQVYLVDNGSRDGTAEAVRAQFPQLQLVRLERNLGAAGRNYGVKRVHTPYVAFADDDTWWARGALRRAADILDAHPQLAVLSAKVLVGARELEDDASTRMAASPLANDSGVPGSVVLGFMAGACMMRRTAFLAAGGYEPRFFFGGEESLLALDLMSAGWVMAYAPDVIVRHHPSPVRNVSARRRMRHRNALWCAWLRRPWSAAVKETRRLVREARTDRSLALGLIDGVWGLPWILARRRVVPPRVEEALQQLDAFYAGDWAARALPALDTCRQQP